MKALRLVFQIIALISLPLIARDKSHETCFLAVPFVKGATAAISLDNEGKKPKEVTIERFSAAGTILDSITKVVASKAKIEIRLDLSAETLEFGWFRSVEKGAASVQVSSVYEYLNGNTLTSIPQLAVYRHPVSEGAVRSAYEYSIRHRYTYDILAVPGGVAYFFVNLSTYPVDAGMCQADYPGCVNAELPRAVPPMASVSSRLARYLS